MRVSLSPARVAAPVPAAPDPLPLLDPAGASVVVGTAAGADGLVAPLVPAADTLFGPRGACLAEADGPLVVADTGHHRLLLWRRRPERDFQPADLLVGQPDFGSEGRNARGGVGPATLNVPTGVACEGGVLAVADAWNHRVLLWLQIPERSNQPADVVLGQADFASGLANRGADRPGADTLHWSYGVTLAGGRLFVADTGNRRVLVWDQVPRRNGTPADLVLGQRDFTTRDENAGAAPGPIGMRWPHAVVAQGGGVLVTDAGNNRVMGWRTLPAASGQPCDLLLGQRDAAHVDHNQAGYYPTAATVNMPYGLAWLRGRLVVADTANSRLLGFEGEQPAATALAGQRRFIDKGDNRWGFAARDSLCWPYGVAARGATLVVADSGNNRVLLWESVAR